MSSQLIKFKEQKIVNIKNVTSIGLFPEKNRIVFNMNYGITLPNSKQIISDYVYWEASNQQEFNEMQRNAKLYSGRWIISPKNSYNERYINPDYISSIVFDINTLKIIFNLSHSVSMKNSESLTSEFVYFKFNDIKEFARYKQEILTII